MGIAALRWGTLTRVARSGDLRSPAKDGNWRKDFSYPLENFGHLLTGGGNEREKRVRLRKVGC